ncbi:MAG: hypothetical protein HY678_05355 [Chloroflexi bacterium]|nr:hypothetical protein [Chloroflexota bacterium]
MRDRDVGAGRDIGDRTVGAGFKGSKPPPLEGGGSGAGESFADGRGRSRLPLASEVAAGLIFQTLVFAFPTQFYPFVWIAPFLFLDGILGLAGRTNLAMQLCRGQWREAVAIGAAGLVCGFLWEFWNFWSSPKWVYSVPLLGFGKVFEMPILGYAGYVPFAWTVVQFVRLTDKVLGPGATGRAVTFRNQ